MKKYNGYDSYAAWNVSLWINNNEDLYRLAKRYTRCMNREDASLAILRELQSMGIDETPDGVKYSKTTIKKALVGF